jgi:hypothetical protein
MYKNYQCPTCKMWQSFPVASAPVLQPACTTPRCFGRLNYESTSANPIPNPPGPAPAPLSAHDLAFATRPFTVNRDGSFCRYDILMDRGNYTITFTGQNKGTGKNYAFNLSGMKKEYEIPSWANSDDGAAQMFIKNSNGELNWEPGPSNLPRVLGPAPARKVISLGHDANLLTSPIRMQLGAQNENDQHSGSGFIHLMFSHDRDSVMGVQQLIHQLLFPATNIKAIYKTKAMLHGAYRFIILAGNADLPHQIILDAQEGFLRIITVYKSTESIKNYNKFKSKPAEFSRLYSANSDIF